MISDLISDQAKRVQMRPIFTMLGNVAKRTGAAIVLVGHLNKSENAKDIYRGFGSADIMAAVRSVLQCEKADNGERYLRTIKSNFDSCPVPFTDWIGKRTEDGTLAQRPDTVWCECEVEGEQETIDDRKGKRTLPSDWYYFRTKPGQPFPWIISNKIFIRRILGRAEVEEICREHGVEAQQVWNKSLDRGLENS